MSQHNPSSQHLIVTSNNLADNDLEAQERDAFISRFDNSVFGKIERFFVDRLKIKWFRSMSDIERERCELLNSVLDNFEPSQRTDIDQVTMQTTMEPTARTQGTPSIPKPDQP